MMRIWRALWWWRELAIEPTDLVLEIGSGHNPLVRANVLMDKYLFDNIERDGDLVIDRPFVVGDAEQIPFAVSTGRTCWAGASMSERVTGCADWGVRSPGRPV